MNELCELRLEVPGTGEVGALALVPPAAGCLLVFGHGAGAGMRHPFMEGMARRLAERRIATLRYQFPYMEAGKPRPDQPAVLLATVRAAVSAAATLDLADVPVVAGGKSMGGRITAEAQAADPLPGVAGLVFFGFPLHAPGRPSSHRAASLEQVGVPLLFLQGTRDALADLGLLAPVVEAHPRAEMVVFDGADHSFHVNKSSGTTDEEVRDRIADAVAEWLGRQGFLSG
jgi:predicted alpha/beta-hydrolase family hydrolase